MFCSRSIELKFLLVAFFPLAPVFNGGQKVKNASKVRKNLRKRLLRRLLVGGSKNMLTMLSLRLSASLIISTARDMEKDSRKRD